MPYIETKTNVKVSDSQKIALKEKLADAITLIRGKSEEWLMLGFTDGITMSFRGDIETPLAMIEVDIFGKASSAEYDALTQRICDVISSTIDVPKDRIYVKYRECDKWGYNGFNF